MIRWQPVAVRGDQVIHQRPDLIQVEFGGGMRVEHRCVVDMIAFAGQRRLDRERLDVDIGLP